MNDTPTTEPAATYSHPDQPVRHSYPLANPESGFVASLHLLNRTLPYAVVRFGILVAVSIISIIWGVVTFGGAGFLGQKIHPWVGYGWLFGGMGVYGYLWRFILRYALYLIKCGHIAVLTELITTNQVGNGSEGMFAYGKAAVTKRFGQVNVLFGLDLLIHGVVRAFNRTLDWIATLLPIPGLNSIAGVIKAVVHSATTFIDETIFSYNLARGDENPWRSSTDGVIYYAQNSKEILKTAVLVVVLDKVLTIGAWLLMLVPAAAITAILPATAKGGGGVALFAIAVLFAWNIRAAFLQPLFLIMIMTKYHSCIQNQEINLEWDAKLDSVTSKFGELKAGIGTWSPTKSAAPVAQPTASPPPPPSA